MTQQNGKESASMECHIAVGSVGYAAKVLGFIGLIYVLVLIEEATLFKAWPGSLRSGSIDANFLPVGS
jgi:hypothetical protein